MKIPVMRGVIERRILVNYRVAPRVLEGLLPQPFRPKLVGGMGMAGICLIRLKHVRPTWAPAWLGVSSENAAHRIAVEWNDRGTVREGVYIPRRDTSSRLNALVGGRLFPGLHQHATFASCESADCFEVGLHSNDGLTRVLVRSRRVGFLPSSTIFRSLDEASTVFQAGSLGYSATADASRFQGLELRCTNWQIEPLEIDDARSSFFDDPTLFPKGSIALDCALLMRNIEHQWHGKPDLLCPAHA